MPRLNIDALASELEKLDELDGITPEAVVGVARDPNNILHPHFEWDDAKAGHAHRLQQARHLIKRVKITTPAGGTTSKYVSVMVVGDAGDRVYEPMERVVLDQTKWSFVIGETLAVVDEASAKIGVLTDLAGNPGQVSIARNLKRACFDLRAIAIGSV
jgi:hypothetical protein